MKINGLILLLFLVGGFTSGQAKQVDRSKLVVADSTFEQMVKKNDGSIYVGRIIEVTKDSVLFKTAEAEFSIAINEIKDIEKITVGERGYHYPDKNKDKLFFAPTGRTLKKGEGYFIDTYIFFPGISYGLTDRITIGGGFSLFPGLDMNEQVYYFMPKIGLIQNKNYSLAISSFIFQFPDEVPPVGFIFGMNTYEIENVSLTAGLGYGFYDHELADKPAVILGADWRFSRKFAFLTENWIVPDEEGEIISYGIRIINDHVNTDLGFANTFGDDFIFPGYLYGSMTIHF